MEKPKATRAKVLGKKSALSVSTASGGAHTQNTGGGGGGGEDTEENPSTSAAAGRAGGTLKCAARIISRKTKTERQCTRNAVDGETQLCQQHYSKWYEKTYKKKPAQPWELYGLPTPPDPTMKYAKAITRLRALLRQGPLGRSGAAAAAGNASGDAGGVSRGHIYVYRIENDDPCYFKIGYTTKAVHQRLDEWPGSVLVHSWRTEFPHYAESIIHLYLYHWRCYRFVLYAEGGKPGDQKRFVSTCYSNPTRSIYDAVVAAKPSWLPEEIYEVVKQNQGVTPEIYRKTPRKQRYTVEKEWFRVEDYDSQIKKPIDGILAGIALNRWKK